MLTDNALAISPLDGRYQQKTSPLSLFFSEAALFSYRIKIEVAYFISLAEFGVIRPLSVSEKFFLDALNKLTLTDIKKIKEFESKNHHDMKAVEYYLRDKFADTSLVDLSSFIHFAITSEDINNLAYRCLWRDGIITELDPALKKVLSQLTSLAGDFAGLPILARTHGQAAIPTTLGKELAVYSLRLMEVFKELETFSFRGKFNGAVGGYQAMTLAFPKIAWLKLSQDLVMQLGFNWQILTTQIAPADDLVKLLTIFQRLNLILLDLNQDIWRYISDGWLKQKGKAEFVGSSTMPQKINPIEFENSEGNICLANALYEGMIRKLPVSRLQRDLSDSPVLRSVGSAFGYNLLALQSLADGLSKLVPDKETISADLFANYNILAEAWQTLARKTGDSKAYEKSAKLAKNKLWTKTDWDKFSQEVGLTNLTPANYLGLSESQTQIVVAETKKFLNQYQFHHRKSDYDQQV